MSVSQSSQAPIYLNILCSPHGGIATYVLGLLEAQAQKGASLAIAYNSRRADSLFCTRLSQLPSLFSQNIVNLRTYKLPTLGSFLDLFALFRFCRLQSCRTIVLIAHGTSSVGLAVIILLMFRRSRLFYIPHGGLSHLYSSSSALLRFCVFFYDSILSLCGTRFLCESKYTYDLYLSILRRDPIIPIRPCGYVYSLTSVIASQVHQLSGSLEHSREFVSHRLCSGKSFTVVYLGTWRFIKGPMHLLRVLKSMGPEFEFLPDGRPLYFKFFTDCFPWSDARLQNLGPRISIHPWSSNVSSILETADAQIIPSRGESFGYAAVEALAARLPVVHTNIGGLSEILSGTHMPVIPLDFTADELYSAISYISCTTYDRLLGPSDPLQSIMERSYWSDSVDPFLST
jgi:glycosyltransferase involved in cell wall biosynthesis